MTPKEKAKELVKKTHPLTYTAVHSHNTTGEYYDAKKISLMFVNEIINSNPLEPTDVDWDDSGGTHQYWYESRQEKAMIFWQEVKQEIEKL